MNEKNTKEVSQVLPKEITELFEGVQVFMSQKLDGAPAPKNIKVNKFANNSKYLPIGYIERTLDNVYAGLWTTENFQYKVVLNEIVGTIDLKVFHPVTGTWITRTGAAAVQIQLKSEKGVPNLPTDIDKKILNTLTKDFPHLKSECIKNAAKSLGPIFGRDLNRDSEDSYTSLETIDQGEFESIKNALEQCKDKSQLAKVYGNLDPEQKEHPVIRSAFARRNAQLSPKKPN